MKDEKQMSGFELELFTISNSGKILPSADAIIAETEESSKIFFQKESAKNILEITGSPHEMVPNSAMQVIRELEKAIEISRKNSILLLPLGSYPGKFNPSMRKEKKYSVQASIFGQEKFAITGRCCGFHSHYTLPKGIFDSQLRALKIIAHQKIKSSFVNSYNMATAMDPAICCFMQSSPFYQGENIGKDSRIIMYRGGEFIGSPNGLYSDFQEFGALSHYKMTELDIEEFIATRYEKWKSLIIGLGLNVKTLSLWGSILSTNWSPVKVNPHGTLEMRGMDMNYPSFALSCSIILKFVFKKLQEEKLAVIPSEIGIDTPFKLEKDALFIPPFNHLKYSLQTLSAKFGMENKTVHNYCSGLLKFAEPLIPKERKHLIKSFKKALEEKKTISDSILLSARKKGWDGGFLSNKTAAEIAIEYSKKLEKDIFYTKKSIEYLV